ncbi:hypothetical protein Ddye_030590 [Dipteronia dyeriana]|uniref:UDP-MurNAc-pentapeptide synthetase n=1 Tax=Dipteronia dyeriana TaxID=168575 RepID=A0AAD9THM5_9ROSI|nr:hypothetical protein Ddye_030590 [Dipteronia dyeriana]
MTSTSIFSFLHLHTLSEPKSLLNRSGSHSIATKNTNNHTCQTNLHYPLISPVWTVTEIAESVNGKILKWGPPGTICTNTRDLKPGKNQWFFAVTGEHLDGHDFISPELYSKGCVGVVGNRVCDNWDKGFVHVEGNGNVNSINSLINMAYYARNNRFNGVLVGVTGSAGKSTTKRMIALALENLGIDVFESYGNWNNRIGVALSLIGIDRNVDIAVLEMGMSGKGEILELARMAKPQIRVVLNVGASHLESLTSLEEVAMAKGEIFRDAKSEDVCILNGDDPLVTSLPVPHGVKKVLFGQQMGCDIRLVAAETTDGGLGVRVVLEKGKEMVDFVIPSPGLHLSLDACAAATVATLFGVSLAQVGISLSKFVPVHMRSELQVARNGIKIVNDAYNANPISTRAAIDLLKSIACDGKRVAILGDMLELGSNEIEFHEKILSYCCDCRIGLVGLAGKRFLTAAENMNLIKADNIIHADDAEILARKIVKRLKFNDVILVKGSRVMKMEKVVNAIKAMNIHIPSQEL